jgi:hypothetical protein
MTDTIELVLPSGRFARIRKITLADMMISHSDNSMASMVGLATLTTTVDGEWLTAEQWADMEIDEAMPILRHIASSLKEALLHTKGIA